MTTEATVKASTPGRLGAAGAVTVAAALTNGMAYLVPMLGARQLNAGDLSALATALGLAAIASVPGLGIQLAVAVHHARHGRVPTHRITMATAALAGGALVVGTPLLATVLHLPVQIPVLLGVITAAVVVASRWLGELQGEQRFLRLAAGMAVLAVARHGGVIAGLVLGAGLTGSLVSGALVACLSLPVIAWLAAPSGPPSPPAPALAVAAASGTGPPGGEFVPPVEQTAAPAATLTRAPYLTGAAGSPMLDARAVMTGCGATLAMLVVSYADLILARQLLPAVESGAYAVGTVLTKGALWAPQVFTVLALPRLARGDRRTQAVALALTGVCGAVLVLASALAGGLAFRLAGGPDYVHLGGYAPYFATTGALYAVVFVLLNARLATGARRPAAPLWLATAGLAVVALFVAPHTFAGVMFSALGAAALVTVGMAVVAHRHRPVQPTRRAVASGADSGLAG